MKKILTVILLLLTGGYAYAQRLTLNLTDTGNWKIWLDKEASWKEDKLFLPGEFVLSDLPVNPPTCGWEQLFNTYGKSCQVPTTVEEQFGTTHDWKYHGVSWFYTTFNPNSDWQHKQVFLNIEKYNHRIEVYLNGKLVGYDAIGLLPYQCDISNALKIGTENQLALRITGVGGIRGWEDFHVIKWGEQTLLPDKDYSGIGGEITLTGVDSTFIADVFVKNLQPAKANNIEVEASVMHNGVHDTEAIYELEIYDIQNQQCIFRKTYDCVLQEGTNLLTRRITVPQARLWNEHTPQLYTCKIALQTEQSNDLYTQDFGFRVFEVKQQNGRTHYYLNGERIRLKSAIDWSIYAYNGMFPTDEVAQRTIKAVKAIGHNSLNFHRRAGDTPVFEQADIQGVYMYEEPGGFHTKAQGGCDIEEYDFARKQIYERVRRMVIRDRNHPSLLIYTLCNEDNVWTHAREMAMRIIQKYDPTRLIANSSGGNYGGFSKGGIAHIRPYEQEIRMDYNDHHTVQSGVTLDESDLNREHSIVVDQEGKPLEHVSNDSLSITYWGEVRCYAGTFNYPLLHKQGEKNGMGYDRSMYTSQANKAQELFESCRLKGMGNGNIQSVYDLTRFAGQGQYYTNGRLEQVILSNDYSDGYAINGWSPGPDMPDEWSSALVDQNRNLNSFQESLSYWNRPLQIAIMRLNGKYKQPGDTIRTNIFLINEQHLPAGKYHLLLQVKDGNGDDTGFREELEVNVRGGDVFAQTISRNHALVIDPSWASGYLTLEGTLYRDNEIVADGKEQVLLKNRPSQQERFRGKRIAVLNWPQAQAALKEAHIAHSTVLQEASVILLGKNSTQIQWNSALAAVKKGASLIVQTDSLEGEILFKRGLLKEPIKVWGGLQSGFWNGNGSSYIDVFAGKQTLAQSGVISTRSWEATGNPRGFFPFRSKYKQRAYGLYFAHQYKRNGNFTEANNTLVTYGELEFGKGRILLNTSYWVDENTAFSDLLFFNMLAYYAK